MAWLSFITPLTLYRKKTASGTLLEVFERYGQLRLHLDGHPQSNSSYRRDWKKIFRRSHVSAMPQHGSALVLGLGGGDMAYILKQMHPTWHVTFVELEHEVIEVARTYFGVSNTKGQTIILRDAQAYVANNKTTHDLVVVDLYSGDDVPSFVSESIFLRNIARALKPKGLALFNYASHTFSAGDFIAFEKRLRTVFTSVVRMKTWGHTFYLATV